MWFHKNAACEGFMDLIKFQASSLVSELPITPANKSFLRTISCCFQNVDLLTIGNRVLNLTANLRTISFIFKILNGDHKWLLKPEKKY